MGDASTASHCSGTDGRHSCLESNSAQDIRCRPWAAFSMTVGVVAVALEQVGHLQPDSGDDICDIAAPKTMHQHPVAQVADRKAWTLVVVSRAQPNPTIGASALKALKAA